MADQKKPQKTSAIQLTRKTEINLELDDEKLEAIKACLKKGSLTITIDDADLSESGRLIAPYLYD